MAHARPTVDHLGGLCQSDLEAPPVAERAGSESHPLTDPTRWSLVVPDGQRTTGYPLLAGAAHESP